MVDMSFRQAITMSFRSLRTRSMAAARDERIATVTTLNFDTTSGLGVRFPSPCPRVLEHAKIKILACSIVKYWRVLLERRCRMCWGIVQGVEVQRVVQLHDPSHTCAACRDLPPGCRTPDVSFPQGIPGFQVRGGGQ